MTISTPATKLFGIKHPILLAGMNQAAGPRLAAAVTNAGGLGVIGGKDPQICSNWTMNLPHNAMLGEGVTFTPKYLQQVIDELKAELNDKNAPFGVDLLLPQVGGTARKTNHDYTHGKLDELISIIINNKAALFVSAVGVPPIHVVDRLHRAKIPVMNVVGHPKHIPKALAQGVDIICCQGGEGGGHTGDVPFSILIPKAVEMVAGQKSPLTGEQVQIIAAGGIWNGKGLAMALSAGASAVWVGTRFVCAEEAGAPPLHQKDVIECDHGETIRTTIYTGRPMRVRQTPFILDWENNKKNEIKRLTSQGIVPVPYLEEVENRPRMMGQVAAVIEDIKPARQIVHEMVAEAAKQLTMAASYVVGAKL